MDTQVTGMIICLGCGVVLPTMIVWLQARAKAHKTNKSAEIILAAMEKNPNIDIKELMKNMSRKETNIKERLFKYLFYGFVCIAIGLGLAGATIYQGMTMGWQEIPFIMTCTSVLMPLLGIGFIMTYVIGKRMFRKELEEGYRKE